VNEKIVRPILLHHAALEGHRRQLNDSFAPENAPSPYPLPRGERDLESPSLDGRGKGEGGKKLKSLLNVSQVNPCALAGSTNLHNGRPFQGHVS